jgi:hypothetical protein
MQLHPLTHVGSIDALGGKVTISAQTMLPVSGFFSPWLPRQHRPFPEDISTSARWKRGLTLEFFDWQGTSLYVGKLNR